MSTASPADTLPPPVPVPPVSRFGNLKLDLRELFSFFLPVFLEQLFISLCSILTSSTIGSLGKAEVSAFNLVEVLTYFLLQIFISMGTGVAVVVAQYRGKQDSAGAGRVAVHSLWFFMAFSVFLTAMIYLFQSPILQLVLGQADADVYANGRTSLLVCTFSFPLYMTYQLCINAVRGAGYPRRTMIVIILTNGLYAGFSWLFVKLGFGMYSPGLALFVARLYGTIHGLILLRGCQDNLSIPSLKIRKLDWKSIRMVLSLGIPLSIENLIFQGGRLLTQTMIVPFGTDSLAANGIANNMSNLLLVPSMTLSGAIVPVVGKCIGEGNPKRAKSVTITGLVMTSLMLAVTSLATYLFMTPFVGLYKQTEEVNAIVRSLFSEYLIIMPLIYTLSFNLPNALRAAGDVKFNMYGSIASMIVFRLVLSYFFCNYTDFGVKSIWYSMYIDWVARSTYFGLRFLSGAWTKKKVV